MKAVDLCLGGFFFFYDDIKRKCVKLLLFCVDSSVKKSKCMYKNATKKSYKG